MNGLFFLVFLVGGVPEIHNGLIPKSSPITIDFKEDLRLSPESGESYHVFTGGTTSVEVDAAGHIFVADTAENRVLHFDEDGKFLGQIGREGSGPGEFLELADFQLLADGSAVALMDVNRKPTLQFFDNEMKFSRLQVVQGGGFQPFSARFSMDGSLGVAFYQGRNKQGEEWLGTGIIDAQFNIVRELKRISVPKSEQDYSNPKAYWVAELARFMNPGASGLGIAVFSRDGKFYTASANTYTISRYDQKQRLERIYHKQYKPIYQDDEEKLAMAEPLLTMALSAVPPSQRKWLTKEVMAAGIEGAGFKDAKLPIFDLIPMENGHLLVVHDVNFRERTVKGDIFSPEGRFLGAAKLPPIDVTNLWATPRRLVFRNGYAYALETNEDGEYELARYKYRLVSSGS